MFRQIGMSAAAVLTAGLVAVGCGSDGDTIISGAGGTDLNNSDAFNATSLASNNVAPDGGGLSPDDMNATTGEVQIQWNCDVSDSDGPFSGDNTAMVLFQVNDGGRFRRCLTHFSNGFTVPVEIKLPDMDETVGSDVGAACMLPVNTSAYVGGTGFDQQANDTRTQNLNWYTILDYQTKFQDPRLTQTHTPGTNVLGPHRAIGLVVFVNALRNVQGITVSDRVGGVNQNFINGFQEIGTEVEIARGGSVAGGVAPAGTAAPGRATPASNVQSFGFVTNGFAGQATFGGDGTPLRPETAGAADYNRAVPVSGALRDAAYEVGENCDFIGILYTQIVNSFSTGGAGTTGNGLADADGGDATDNGLGGEDLKMFFVSMNLTNNTIESTTTHVEIDPPAQQPGHTGALSAATGFYPQFSVYNQFVFVKYADASLNVQVGTINFDPLALIDQFDGGAGLTDAQTWAQAETGGHEGHSIVGGGAPGFWEDMTARFVVVNDGDGTCSIATGAGGSELRDNNFYGADDIHDLNLPTFSLTTATPTYPNNREMQNYNQGNDWVFGADEGLVDTVVFYTSSPNSDPAGSSTIGTNIDRELLAIGLANDGTLLATAANNPRVLSTHQHDFHSAANDIRSTTSGTPGPVVSSDETLSDPLIAVNAGDTDGKGAFGKFDRSSDGANAHSWFRTAMNRSGEYVMVGYLQDQGTSLFNGTSGGFREALCAVVYQTARPDTAGSTTSGVLFENRFSAPSVVSDVQAVTLPTAIYGTAPQPDFTGRAEKRESWTSLPVNQFKFQDELGYRCGLQGNSNIMNLLWEQSDSTEDRLFVRQVQVTLGSTSAPGTAPTITLGTTAELDANDAIQGSLNTANAPTDLTSQNSRATFRFINGDLRTFSEVRAVDLGDDPDPAATNSADGGVLIVYAKTIDNTTSDNDLADAAVFATQYVGAAIGNADRVILNNNVNENAATNNQFGGDAGAAAGKGDVGVGTNPGAGATPSTNGNMNFGDTGTVGAGDFRTGVAEGFATGHSSDITVASNDADGVYIYFYDPRNDNVSSGRALYTRKYRADIRGDTGLATANPDFGDRFVPAIDQGFASAGFQPPTRLDHLQGGDVLNTVSAEGTGVSALVLFPQDGHLWAQATQDGEAYLTVSGAPNPALVDNDTTADVVGQDYKYDTCDDGQCGIGNAILLLIKEDTDGDNRLRGRTGRGF